MCPVSTGGGSTSSVQLDTLLSSLDGATFEAWYDEFKHRENIEEGTPYFNNNGSVEILNR